ncbi:hypothetical protein AGMMS49941_11970 [Deferribacterales bacterium]|nr:hypothetical protein AGMMS49941_11970 [Deferribacterales bacterium]
MTKHIQSRSAVFSADHAGLELLVGGSFGMSNGSSSYQQTQISSLMGTDFVDIDLSMTGSTIANRDEHGNDKGNLNIVASSLNWGDSIALPIINIFLDKPTSDTIDMDKTTDNLIRMNP